jgi:hypothetical protein
MVAAAPDWDVAYTVRVIPQMVLIPRIGVSALYASTITRRVGVNAGLGIGARVGTRVTARLEYTYRYPSRGPNEDLALLSTLTFGVAVR